jgi:hypothetical protein
MKIGGPACRRRLGRSLAALAALAVAAAAPSAAAAEPAPPPGRERFTGLWRGLIVNRPAELEVEIVVELGLGVRGELAGTIDVPTYRLAYLPLEELRTAGDRIEFGFRRHSETFGEGALSSFAGELVAGGGEIRGEYLEAGGARRLAFRLERAGEAGAPRPEISAPPLASLAAGGDELRALFNGDRDRVRLVLLLSPG